MEYIHWYGKGLRLYIGKENMETLKEGQKRKLKLTIIHNFIKYSFYGALLLALNYILRAYHVRLPIVAAVRASH